MSRQSLVRPTADAICRRCTDCRPIGELVVWERRAAGQLVWELWLHGGDRRPLSRLYGATNRKMVTDAATHQARLYHRKINKANGW